MCRATTVGVRSSRLSRSFRMICRATVCVGGAGPLSGGMGRAATVSIGTRGGIPAVGGGTAAIAVRVRLAPGRPAEKQCEYQGYQTKQNLSHDLSLLVHGFLGAFDLAEGMVPDAACVLISANGMRFALAAFESAKVSGGTVRSSCQLENSTWLRKRSGSSRKIARTIWGSLSSVPIHNWMNTPLSTYATISVVVPATTWDWPT